MNAGPREFIGFEMTTDTIPSAQPDPTTPEPPVSSTPLIAKRARISQLFGIGPTLLRELHSSSSANFDDTFPKPFTLTEGGPGYFEVQAVWIWVKTRQAKCAMAAAGSMRRGRKSSS